MVVSSDWKSTWLNPWVTANDTDAFNAGTNLGGWGGGRDGLRLNTPMVEPATRILGQDPIHGL
jgi:hypothetical protein